ncbi:MAG: 23S rRNA (guanosine(2251)-2'-O)-methyltransferase RlmB [Alphaproteobacteria bacterium]|nr:23S rRNA (guanosine(2251)-2'-O)-methyltransferase RlmB [Alphaproteobacteria bacterium]MBU2116387.1 23S rRNA (guanosine(2251)-2'-O)-methyltransferase RlmB [Alphaproteobacteria bacterium]MBU2351060.1 23S rRNA (guanosine(2251)-2'-O)-methyltransferase RlmB [Alphaproteobacteria bacterium]MBU2381434.1 23S rRNA (guanosine(2251)-2'-O)-methyltransferase RlmB [Alphaproteobacteria bacterium]
MSSKRERNDRNKAFSGRPKGPVRGGEKPAAKGFDPAARPRAEAPRAARTKVDPDTLLWGRHPVLAALANPARKGMGRLIATAERGAEIAAGGLAPGGHTPEIMDAADIARMLPPGAVHQGLVFKVAPLEGVPLAELAEPATGVIVMLDQITDPQNVGAIFRSALAFGARGIVVQDRHSPALAGALAKAAVGATERLPHARVTNLSRALETLAEAGWRAVGLDGDTDVDLSDALNGGPTVLVMGSEGDGIRRLVAEHCDVLARIPMPGGFESLNVSNAAAVALYEATRRRTGS